MAELGYEEEVHGDGELLESQVTIFVHVWQLPTREKEERSVPAMFVGKCKGVTAFTRVPER